MILGPALIAASAVALAQASPAPPVPLPMPTPAAADLARDLQAVQEAHAQQEERISALEARVSGRLTGYLDFGFFAVQGDGSGIRPDTGYGHYPEYQAAGFPDTWVFMGDPLSTAINARGEPADTGPSRALAFDSVDSHGKASFLVNALDVALFAGLGPDLTLNAVIDFVPRGRNVSLKSDRALGDFLDVKLAYAEYTLPFERLEVRLSAGKFDSGPRASSTASRSRPIASASPPRSSAATPAAAPSGSRRARACPSDR